MTQYGGIDLIERGVAHVGSELSEDPSVEGLGSYANVVQASVLGEEGYGLADG